MVFKGEKLKSIIQRLIELETLIPITNGAAKLQLISEREELLSDPYIYDKYYGLKYEGII